MITIGDRVTSLLSAAKTSALIVAPFTRSETLEPLLNCILDGVEISVVTRWRPADLLAGASDLGVFDLTEARGIGLYIRNDLHAKLFATEDSCLVGSANVTNTALGWRTPANLELLVDVPRSDDDVVTFEKKLLTGAVRATIEQRTYLQNLIDKLHQNSLEFPIASDDLTGPGLLTPSWLPRTKNPDELYLYYGGNNDFSRAVVETMEKELEQIGVSPGMSEEEFRMWIAAAIIQTPLVSRVKQYLDEHGEVTEAVIFDLLTGISVNTQVNSPREVLQVLERWFTYFLAEHYETTPDKIKLIKAKSV